MLYCFDTRIPDSWFYIKEERKLTEKNGNGILYDGENHRFLDFQGHEIDIIGQTIFPRTGSAQIYEMNCEIIKHGGIPVLSNDEINQVDRWPNFYSGNRKIQILKGRDLIDDITRMMIEKVYGKEIFLKTKEKNFSSVIPTALLGDQECVFYRALLYHLDEEFIISEKMELVKDEFGTKEYRCFIRNHQVINISRMTDTVLHKVDKNVYDYAKEVVESLKEVFPSDYVLDIAEKQKDEITELDVVEINPIHCSGIYLYNSIIPQTSDILHENIWDFPEEWKSNQEAYQIDGTMIEDRGNLYEQHESFASDLRSIYLTDERGLVFTELRELGVKEFSRRGKIVHDFIPITDDEDLRSISYEPGETRLSEEDEEKIMQLLRKYKDNI